MVNFLRFIAWMLIVCLGSLFACPEAGAVGWKTAPGDEVRQHGDGQHAYAGPEAERKGEDRWVSSGNRAEQFFSEPLEDAGENGPSAPEQCRINGWLNYDTTSEYTVAARNTPTPSSTAIQPYYPANQGFLGQPTNQFLMPGQRIDRFGGSDFSRFFSPAGTPAPMRALPAGSSGQPLRSFEVLKPFEVRGGTVAPAFNQPGLGTQYLSPVRLEVLLKRGIIREVP